MTAGQRTEIDGLEAKYIDVHGIRTRYYEAGQENSDVIVLCHGGDWSGGFSANIWSRNIAGLAERFHVYAPDKLGQGLTDNPADNSAYTITAQTQHFHHFIQTMGIERCHLAGQSRGAYPPARLALEHPELVKSLVIVATATLAPDIGDVETRRGAIYASLPTEPRARARELLSAFTYFPECIDEAYLDAFLQLEDTEKSRAITAGIKTNKSIFFDDLNLRKAETISWLEEGRLSVPTLLFWGKEDRTALLDQGLLLFDLLARGKAPVRMVTMNQARHYLFREHAAEWNEQVSDFCTRWGK